MIISDRKRFIFVHVEKTAGTPVGCRHRSFAVGGRFPRQPIVVPRSSFGAGRRRACCAGSRCHGRGRTIVASKPSIDDHSASSNSGAGISCRRGSRRRRVLRTTTVFTILPMKRRDLVGGLGLAAGALLASGLGYGFARGIRFPVIQAEPAPRPRRLQLLDPGIEIDLDGAYLKNAARTRVGLALDVRAFAPQPVIRFAARRSVQCDLRLANVSPRAVASLSGGGAIDERPDTRVNRVLRLELPAGEHALSIAVPFERDFRFSVIGDSGAGSELRWCLERSARLGVDFVLHAGDFYYSDADFRSLAPVLDESPVPVYASIGNHDFHRDGRFIHRDFTREVGPRNSFFALGETMVVNFDTAASTWPVGFGERAALFQALEAHRDRFRHFVLMTHRPLHDPRFQSGSDEAHALSERETGWVADRLLELTPQPVLLAGHIHVSAEHFEDGIKTFISGEGLGSRNLVSGREIARILVGEKRSGEAVRYQWQPLEMPGTAYCHEKNREVLTITGKPAPQGSFGAACRAQILSPDSA